MDAQTRRLVRERAGERCESCGLPQVAPPLSTFHVGHVTARQHGGSDDPSNLALSCHHCNPHKGPNLTGIDPESGDVVPPFNPRREPWPAHFTLQGLTIVGQTSIGRATVRVLAMNSASRRQAREA